MSEKTAAGLERLIRPELLRLGYTNVLASQKVQTSLVPVLMMKLLLQAYFSVHHYRKQHFRTIARKADLRFLNIKGDDRKDLTLRPDTNLDYIRSIVGGPQR